MSIGSARERSAKRSGAVEGAIVAGCLVILAGLVIPALQTWQLRSDSARAREDMARIKAAVLAFLADTGQGPTRGRDGDDHAIYRLTGPGLIAPDSYYFPDQHQGWLADHLERNTPCGRARPGYSNWKGPYLSSITPDPWGFAYIVIVYPLFRDDDRDCIVVSAGPNGHMDSTYASPRDPIPSGDDLMEVIVHKGPERRAPLY